MKTGKTHPQLAPPIDPSAELLTHGRLLGARLYLHTWLRSIIIVLILAGTLIEKYFVQIDDSAVDRLVFLALGLAAYNVIVWFIVRPYRDSETTDSVYGRLRVVMYATVLLDYLGITIGAWLVGGTRSHFLVLYLLHVMISSLLLSRRGAIFSTVSAFAMLATLVLGEWRGLIPTNTPIGAVADSQVIDGQLAFTVLVIYGAVFGVTTYLLAGLSHLLRAGEQELRDANESLLRVSNTRRDFLHIATHNIQSPVGAVTMILNNLRTGMCGRITDDQAGWIDRALKRLDGLTDFVRDLQMTSTLESGKIDAEAIDVDVGPILESLVEEYRDEAEARDQKLILAVDGEIPPVRGVERLLREAIVNYITNAIKYTPSGGTVRVQAGHHPPNVRIEVVDTGIGLSKEDQEKLFNEFVRIQRKDKSVSGAKGTGLGLSIVKRIIKAHGGRTFVESEVGRGSSFIIELPVAAQDPSLDPTAKS